MRPNRPRQKKQPRQWIAKRMVINDIEFDSLSEAAYYKRLLKDEMVQEIETHPQFTIIDTYTVECKRCRGAGRLLNPKTMNLNQCSLCKGKGKREKGGAIYTADFKVTYKDGYVEFIDIKGGPASKDFPLRKKLFEEQTGVELVIVEQKGREFIRKA
ncbi:DUF1064 domain-containing protein [Jeotgalibacillus campisalis]|uniref:DUF1064 domain-containing protein n=1 Tax=Jeotgalibacillus campisalis TaxID=220754 RepID=A0A0C2VNZ9_9BACL|nr:DUF1064 domain-containing protein [Jeotgalibacillus campisalis]KIL46176.1 hypothetical protein KR50_28510 [Jeotgalibacillus campisalis]